MKIDTFSLCYYMWINDDRYMYGSIDKQIDGWICTDISLCLSNGTQTGIARP